MFFEDENKDYKRVMYFFYVGKKIIAQTDL